MQMRSPRTPRRVRGLMLAAWLLLNTVQTATVHAEGEEAPGITYVEQPVGIELTEYVRAWPELDPYVARLEKQRMAVKADLQHAVGMAAFSEGALNLLSQLEREDGNLDEAESLIGKAITINSKQHLHYFQLAMILYARLEQSSGWLERWGWHRKTKDAYRRAFELDQRSVPCRYYLAYTYLQEPWLVGGDKDEALRLAQQGIDIGLKEFFVVRADVHRLRGEVPSAFADYDESIRLSVFKLNSYLGAGYLALEQKEFERAKRYFEYAVRCRVDSPRTHDGLGDYYVTIHETQAAAQAYETALQKDPNYSLAREKLSRIKRNP
ncbi:MAG: tetratricopeptide repeat protein [Candidatus Polarisedimenticolia bacterium]